MVKRTVLYMFLLLLALPMRSQRQDFLASSELLLYGGGMNYMGDLNDQSALSLPRLAGGLGIRYRIGNRWALRATASYGSVACEEDYIKLRNLSFKSNIFEAAAVAEFNFAPFGAGATDRQWTPYIFGGLGVFYFNPMAPHRTSESEIQWVELPPLHTEGQGSAAYPDRRPYALVQMCMPFGVGVKLRLGKSFSLSAEYGFRKTWTDYLDDVSTTYVAREVLMDNAEDGNLAVAMADRSGEVEEGYANAPGIKRGDDSLDDWYAFFHISLGISFDTMFGWMRSKRCRN